MKSTWLDKLNDAQRQAVTHGDGPLLVIAGAGTGKTMTLACRVAHLIESGVRPEEILLLTFTRRAAAEMTRRAENLTGQGQTSRVWGGTFHAVANRILRIHGQAVGLPPDFTICDQSDAADMMNLIRNESGVAKKNRRFPKKETLIAIYSRSVAAREKLDEVLKTRFPWCREELEGIRTIFQQYTTIKRDQGILDYDDLLLFWNALATADTAVGDRFSQVLVDEYQDTNAVQGDILRAMRRGQKNICAVGDDAQSIYSFRAATIRNILDFPDHFPGAVVVKLEQNYRSTQPILAASNAVMAEAKERYTKELWSNRTSDQKPVLVHCMDEREQCALCCDNIVDHLEQGTALSRQAVLFRAGHHSDQLEVELARRNIPFHKFGGLKFIESAHVKDLLAFLRILENPYDEVSWMRVLLLIEGIGPRTARRIKDALDGADVHGAGGEEAATERVSPLRRLIENPPPVPPAAREWFAALREMLNQCYALAPGRPGDADESAEADRATPTLAVEVERARKFYEPIFEKRYDNAPMRLRDLEQLEQIAAGYRSRRRFLSDLTLDPPSSTSDLAQPPFLDEDFLILSTIHSAKGCEWDVVHIIHLADGMIPSDMAVTDEAGVEEERRLLYVAMTRAKDALYAYFPLRYYHKKHAFGDAHSYAQLSRFVSGPVRGHFVERTAAVDEDTERRPRVKGDTGSVDRFLRELWEK